MLVEEELARVSPAGETLLTIGVFDGVHLGHQHLISQLVKRAKQQSLLSGVVTFRQHPQDYFSPETRLPLLTDMGERTALLKKEGVDLIVPLSFNTELAGLSARKFIRLLQEHLRLRGLVVGPDFALGRNREGDVPALQQFGREMGFSVSVVVPLNLEGEVVSSTAVRRAIATGDMEKARRLMGRPFSLEGKVVTGTHRGMELGFPTANLGLNQEQVLPAEGVYASWASVNSKTYLAMTNIGTNPTFNGRECTAEVYLIDYQGDLYGQELKVDMVKRLRGEKKFGSAEALKEQIAQDVAKGKEILSVELKGQKP
ncbi:bifunctional riboflavin kinase/FAD synthetase [Chloroflexota bacterium]